MERRTSWESAAPPSSGASWSPKRKKRGKRLRLSLTKHHSGGDTCSEKVFEERGSEPASAFDGSIPAADREDELCGMNPPLSTGLRGPASPPSSLPSRTESCSLAKNLARSTILCWHLWRAPGRSGCAAEKWQRCCSLNEDVVRVRVCVCACVDRVQGCGFTAGYINIYIFFPPYVRRRTVGPKPRDEMLVAVSVQMVAFRDAVNWAGLSALQRLGQNFQ